MQLCVIVRNILFDFSDYPKRFNIVLETERALSFRNNVDEMKSYRNFKLIEREKRSLTVLPSSRKLQYQIIDHLAINYWYL